MISWWLTDGCAQGSGAGLVSRLHGWNGGRGIRRSLQWGAGWAGAGGCEQRHSCRGEGEEMGRVRREADICVLHMDAVIPNPISAGLRGARAAKEHIPASSPPWKPGVVTSKMAALIAFASPDTQPQPLSRNCSVREGGSALSLRGIEFKQAGGLPTQVPAQLPPPWPPRRSSGRSAGWPAGRPPGS